MLPRLLENYYLKFLAGDFYTSSIGRASEDYLKLRFLDENFKIFFLDIR